MIGEILGNSNYRGVVVVLKKRLEMAKVDIFSSTKSKDPLFSNFTMFLPCVEGRPFSMHFYEKSSCFTTFSRQNYDAFPKLLTL